jgi:hypothetical protein
MSCSRSGLYLGETCSYGIRKAAWSRRSARNVSQWLAHSFDINIDIDTDLRNEAGYRAALHARFTSAVEVDIAPPQLIQRLREGFEGS